MTGSDTSSNSLFGALQVQPPRQGRAGPGADGGANSSGGVLGKMICPQNLAIAAAAVGMAGREGDIFRKVFGWSLLLLAFMCVIVVLQSTRGAGLDGDLTRCRGGGHPAGARRRVQRSRNPPRKRRNTPPCRGSGSAGGTGVVRRRATGWS